MLNLFRTLVGLVGQEDILLSELMNQATTPERPTMTIDLPDLPDGWSLAAIVNLGEADWQVNLRSDEHVVSATGQSPFRAALAALRKADRGEYLGRLYFPPTVRPRLDSKGLLAQLGFNPRPDFKLRRL
jgi:hypothetical protein